MRATAIEVSVLRTDGGTQTRERIDADTVDAYASEIGEGAELPRLWLGHARAARLNYAGACDAQEADGTMSDEERTGARRRMLEGEAREDASEARKAALGEGS